MDELTIKELLFFGEINHKQAARLYKLIAIGLVFGIIQTPLSQPTKQHKQNGHTTS
jgi:hypothetical protein